MTPAESLILDAKQAILEEQHRRFQVLQEEGRWQEALQQFQTTLGCASGLLNHSLSVLERLLADRRQSAQQSELPQAEPPQAFPPEPPRA